MYLFVNHFNSYKINSQHVIDRIKNSMAPLSTFTHNVLPIWFCYSYYKELNLRLPAKLENAVFYYARPSTAAAIQQNACMHAATAN